MLTLGFGKISIYVPMISDLFYYHLYVSMLVSHNIADYMSMTLMVEKLGLMRMHNWNQSLWHKVKKPAGTVEEVERHFGCESARLIMVGDRLFTDIVYGNRAGFFMIFLEPLSLAEEPLIGSLIQPNPSDELKSKEQNEKERRDIKAWKKYGNKLICLVKESIKNSRYVAAGSYHVILNCGIVFDIKEFQKSIVHRYSVVKGALSSLSRHSAPLQNRVAMARTWAPFGVSLVLAFVKSMGGWVGR
ncbi:hypothetical protein Sango_2437000 [Sesamum angolense]|uniref:Uncharacterized protein n=1 Tax=Sesamum angolense TaxID=2727404 RepID=A0AAE1W7Z8_9LAMI|nr:hypothetical protein Sango_2437000 [Sesamum angolense]